MNRAMDRVEQAAMDRVEQAAVLQCFREMRDKIGLGTAQVAAARLTNEDSSISERAAIDCINGKPVKETSRQTIAHAALAVLADSFSAIMTHYESRNKSTSMYIADIFFRHKGMGTTYPQRHTQSDEKQTGAAYVDIIFNNWKDTLRKGNGVLRTGVYQMYRRYKPTDAIEQGGKKGSYDWSNPMNQVIICELIHVDSDSMESLVVTAERNIYFGSMFINHEDVLYGILQRKTRTNGINQRFIAMKLEGKRLPMYSGLCVKVGDTTRRPLASECFYVPVPPSHHAELHAEFDMIKRKAWTGDFVRSVERASVISQYITENPPVGPYNQNNPEWNRVKFVRDFTELAEWVVPNNVGVTYFREPLRTISVDTLAGIASRAILPVFRQGQHS